MIAFLTMLAVLVGDQVVKLLLRHGIGPEPVPLGPFGSVRLVSGRLWLRRLGGRSSAMLWAVWVAAAAALIIVGTKTSSSQLFMGLLLGGSLSNALESTLRGSVSDYICLRFWPAFNLADLALTVGAIGIVAELLMTLRATA